MDCIVPSCPVRGSWQSPRRALPGPWTVENTAQDGRTPLRTLQKSGVRPYSVSTWLGLRSSRLKSIFTAPSRHFSMARKQCSQPSSPSVFGGGRDGLWLVVRLFWGAKTDYARQGKDRTDYRGL